MTTHKTTGPMTSRKSFHLIKHWLSNPLPSVCVKPVAFDRDGAWIKSRACHAQIPCLMLGPGIGHSFGGVDTLYVDEAFGFSLPELRYMSRMAPNVRFYGLDRWATGELTTLGELLTDDSEMLVADCACGAPATMTRLVSGHGVDGVYRAECKECWDK